MNYEHEHRGPRLNIIAVLPSWPTTKIAYASLYTYHTTVGDAMNEWFKLNSGKVTSREITQTVRGTAGLKEGGTLGGLKNPNLIQDRILAVMRKSGTLHRARYNHVVLPDMYQASRGVSFLDHDISIRDTLLERLSEGFTNQIHVYETEIDDDIQPEGLWPVPPAHKDWFCWRLLYSFLIQLPWPINPAYANLIKDGIEIKDTPVKDNLFAYAMQYEDTRSAYLAELS